MKKLGKVSKTVLIIGISITLVGIGLYIFNVSGTIPFLCTFCGSMFAVVGTPYINGVEYPRMLEEQQQKSNLELSAKREYVKRNMHKFGIDANIPQKEVQKNTNNITSTIHVTNDKSQVAIDKPKVKVLVRKK